MSVINADSIIAVVVLYKCRLDNSVSVRTLLQSMELAGWNTLDLVVYDNAPEYNLHQIDYPGFRIHYIPDYTNSGVSRAYNKAFVIGQNLKKNFLLLLDQDTEISDSYCEELSLIDNRYGLIAPVLEDKGVIISPCRYRFGRGSSLKKEDCMVGIKKMKGFNFLNSGSLISLDLFGRVGGFDERIPFYFSDFNFFNRVKKYENHFYLMKTTFHHEMASNDTSNMDRFSTRFRLYCEGAFRCYDHFLGRLMMFINVFLRAFKMGLKCHTLRFLKIAILSFSKFVLEVNHVSTFK